MNKIECGSVWITQEDKLREWAGCWRLPTAWFHLCKLCKQAKQHYIFIHTSLVKYNMEMMNTKFNIMVSKALKDLRIYRTCHSLINIDRRNRLLGWRQRTHSCHSKHHEHCQICTGSCCPQKPWRWCEWDQMDACIRAVGCTTGEEPWA